MSVDDVEQTAREIAERLRDIKKAEIERTTLQNKLDSLSDETLALKEQLNRLDGVITSKKYEITHKLLETSKLSLVKNGD